MSSKIQLSDALAAALEDELLSTALRRNRRLVRLAELNAPVSIIDDSKKLLAKVRRKLGSRFAEVESLAPEFRNWADEQEEMIRDWERKCEGCSHWIDGNDPADNQGIDSAKDSDTWCGKYKVGERTITDPCPSYKDFRSAN